MRLLALFLTSIPLIAGPDDVRERVTRSVALLQKSAIGWKIPCISCHHDGPVMLAVESARVHGITVDEGAAQSHAGRIFTMLRNPAGLVNMPVDTFAFGWGLVGAKAAGLQPGFLSGLLPQRLMEVQESDGRWRANDARPPHSYSDFTATALAIRAIGRGPAVDRARKWLSSHEPASTEDATFRVLGLVWGGANNLQVGSLLKRQRDDGGWSQTEEMQSDAYATGQALYALRVARVKGKAIERGEAWLLRNQQADGSWHVATRLHSKAQLAPPYFESGFPHGKDQFISAVATAWAAMALMETMPQVANPAMPKPMERERVASWMETAVLGSAADLRTLIDAGSVDPKTPEVLMAVASDAAKLRVLLEHGAKPTADVLSAAASHRRSAAAVRLLLEAGVVPDEAALLSAVRGGDLEAVNLLISRLGTVPSASVTASVQSLHPEVTRVLVKAGGAVDVADQNKMTPLMWAAIMHQNDLVETLLEVGADPWIKDAFGLTALDHTKDILFSDTETAALLRGYRDGRLRHNERSRQTSNHERAGRDR